MTPTRPRILRPPDPIRDEVGTARSRKPWTPWEIVRAFVSGAIAFAAVFVLSLLALWGMGEGLQLLVRFVRGLFL